MSTYFNFSFLFLFLFCVFSPFFIHFVLNVCNGTWIKFKCFMEGLLGKNRLCNIWCNYVNVCDWICKSRTVIFFGQFISLAFQFNYIVEIAIFPTRASMGLFLFYALDVKHIVCVKHQFKHELGARIEFWISTTTRVRSGTKILS